MREEWKKEGEHQTGEKSNGVKQFVLRSFVAWCVLFNSDCVNKQNNQRKANKKEEEILKNTLTHELSSPYGW